MKNLKFRIFDKESNVMSYPDSYVLERNWFGVTTEHYLDDSGTGSYPVQSDLFEVMQTSGLFDRDGNEIYDGDIISAEYGIGKVYFCETTCQFKYEFALDSDSLWLYASKSKVLGNIYQNPELLSNVDA